jgi:hypothetical protein
MIFCFETYGCNEIKLSVLAEVKKVDYGVGGQFIRLQYMQYGIKLMLEFEADFL